MAERMASLRLDADRGRILVDVQVPADVNRVDWLRRVELELIFGLGRAGVQIVPHHTIDSFRKEST